MPLCHSIQASLDGLTRKKKKVKKSKRESSSDTSSSSYYARSAKKMTFGVSVTQSLNDVANTDKAKRKAVPASSTVRRIRFLPHVPAIVGESSRTRALRTARLIRASDCKEEFGKSGDARLAFRECTDPKKFIPGILAFF
jgi:hypothetical protein